MTDKQSLASRLVHELRTYAIVVAYLYVCFAAVLFFEATVSEAHEALTVPFGIALVKALILGKFLLIGQAARVGERGRTLNLLHLIVRKSLLLWLLLIALSFVEEIVSGLVHGRSVAMTLAEFGNESAVELFAMTLLLLLVLIPFIGVSETARALGPGTLTRTLLGRPDDEGP